MASNRKKISVSIEFAKIEAGAFVSVTALKAYIKKYGQKEFEKMVAKTMGKRAIACLGWAGLALEAISIGLSLAGYSGITFVTECELVKKTHHQNGDVTTVINIEPRKILSVDLY